MATTFEEQADEFVESGQSDQDYNADIYAPVKLSNSTRRYASARDAMVGGIAENSVYSRTIQNEQARRMEIDRMEDESYAREIEQRAKAAAWNDKVLAQQHGSGLSSMLGDLDPTQPDYLSKLDQALTKYPLAKVDPQIAPLLESRQAVYNVAKEQRDRAAEVAAAQARARENTDYNIAKQREENDRVRAVSDESEMLQNVAKLPAEARVAFEAARKEGKPLYEAMGAANDVASQFVSQKDYGLALRDVGTRLTQNNQLMKELKSIPSYGENAAEDRQRLLDAIEVNNRAIQEAEVTFIQPYQQRKGADPVAENPGPLVPQGDSPRSGAAPAAAEPEAPVSADAPTISLQDAVKKTGNQDLQPGQVLKVPYKTRSGETKFRQYIVTK